MLWYNAGMKANALFCSVVCCCAALSMPCEAADVAVVPGFDFTNVMVRVSGAMGLALSPNGSAAFPRRGEPCPPTGGLGSPNRGFEFPQQSTSLFSTPILAKLSVRC